LFRRPRGSGDLGRATCRQPLARFRGNDDIGGYRSPLIDRIARVLFALALALMAMLGHAIAGPPYLTDDPDPVDYGHWEVYFFSTANFARGQSAGVLPAAEANYGALPNLHLHVQVPVAFNSQSVTGTQFGVGDASVGAKYRFINAEEQDWWPEVATFPTIAAPTGDAARGLGTGRTHFFLPLWLEKKSGLWTTYGGGGYTINPGPGNRDFWFIGWLLQRQVTDSLALGVELFHQTASGTSAPGSVGFPIGTKDTTGFNIGAIYDLSENYHLLMSAGRGIQNASASNEFSCYVALQWTF
jgi:hypothetical protein